MTEDLLRVLHRHVVLQQQRRGGVARVVEAHVPRLGNRPQHHAAALRTLWRLRFRALLCVSAAVATALQRVAGDDARAAECPAKHPSRERHPGAYGRPSS